MFSGGRQDIRMLLSTMFLLLLSAWLSGEGVRKKQVLQKFVADLETERSDLLVRCESAEAQVAFLAFQEIDFTDRLRVKIRHF